MNLPCKPETGFAEDFLKLNTSALALAFEIKIGTGKIEKGFSKPDAAIGSPVYEFDLQRCSGEPQLALYMSLNLQCGNSPKTISPITTKDALGEIVSRRCGGLRG